MPGANQGATRTTDTRETTDVARVRLADERSARPRE
jgi:hypothetical protein